MTKHTAKKLLQIALIYLFLVFLLLSVVLLFFGLRDKQDYLLIAASVAVSIADLTLKPMSNRN